MLLCGNKARPPRKTRGAACRGAERCSSIGCWGAGEAAPEGAYFKLGNVKREG